MISNPDAKSQNTFDVVVLGGGLAGLTLCRQLLLKRPDLKVAVVEKNRFPVSEAAHKVGESTVEIGAHYFSEILGLKKHLTDDQLPKFGLRFFFKDTFQSLAEGVEVGGSSFFKAPSYQVDRGRLENYLSEDVRALGVTIFDGSKVREVKIDESQDGEKGAAHEITIRREGAESQLRSRWIVDASGRASVIKRMLDLEEDLGHDINAVWFRVAAPIQIDSWCADPEWQESTGKVPRRWLSTNHLMGEGYWVWLIPLASGSTSVGIVADPRIHPLRSFNSLDKSLDWLRTHEPECASAMEPHLDNIQDYLAIKKMARGSRQVFSANRWGLVGEAAAFLDPFYSPGSDFIAIGNTMVTKLIDEDFNGRDISHLAPTLQSVFLTLFHNNLLTYRDQYPLFGNPRIMAVKFVWDYAVYWGFPALLFFNEKLTDAGFIQTLSRGVEEIREMNVKMQEFFRHWYEQDPNVDAIPAFVDQSNIEIMTRMNAELTDRLDDSALRQRFNDNVELIRDLMNEITARVCESQPRIPNPVNEMSFNQEHLRPVFDQLNI